MLVYSASLGGGFLFDDQPTILENPSIRDPALAFDYFVNPVHFSGMVGYEMYRPVLLLTYLANYSIAGYSPFVWHLTNVLLHALNAALVALLALALSRRFGFGASPWLPLLAGLAFGMHPLHSEVVNFVSARSGALATAGFLGALILHLRWTTGRGWTRRGFLLTGGLLVFLLGLGAKEIAISLVPVILALELLIPEPEGLRGRIRRAIVRTAPWLAVALLYLVIRSAANSGFVGGLARRVVAQETGGDVLTGGGRTPWENLLTQSRVFWMYLKLGLAPVNLSVDRFVRVSRSLREPAVLAAIGGILVLVGLLLSQAKRRPILPLAGAILLFGLAPTSSILPLNVVMTEHRMYLPGVGMAIVAAWAVDRLLLRRPRVALGLAVAVLLCWSALTVSRSLLWQDPRALWEAAVRASPDSYRAHNQLGVLHYDEAEAIGSNPAALPHLAAAIAEYEKAVDIYPDWYDPHLNLGIAYRERGRITARDTDFERSLEEFERCTSNRTGGWRARYQIASTLGTWKRYDEAIRRFTELAEGDRQKGTGRRLPLYLFPMARLEWERGRYDEAADLYGEALLAAPDDLTAHVGLAGSLVKAGRREEAERHMRDLLAERSEDPSVRLALAEFLLGLDPPDRRGALAQFRKAIALGHRPTPAEFERYAGT